MSSTEEFGPRQRAAATKRQRTISYVTAAALELFDENGYQRTTLNDIAIESGVSVATIFNYFPTKRALAVAAYAPEVLALMASAETELANKADPETVFTSFIQGLATYLGVHPAMAYALLPLSRDIMSPDDESVLAVRLSDLAKLVTTILNSPGDDAEFALCSLMIWIVQHPDHPATAMMVRRFLL